MSRQPDSDAPADPRPRSAEERLRESEQLFAAAFRESLSGLAISTLAEGRFEAVNDAFLGWLGLEREQVVGHTAAELGLWKSPDQRARLVAALERDGVVRQFRHQVPSTHGEPVDLLLSATRIEVGGRPCILFSGENLTESGRVERELAESERKFATVFRANPGALALSRLSDARFLDVNEAFAALVGLPRDQMIGRSALELGLWPDAEERRRAFAPIVEQGSATRVPARVRAASGELREARISGTTLDFDGERCVLILAEDVTELNRAERALADSESRFRAAAEGGLDAFLLLDTVRNESGRVVDFAMADLNQGAARLAGRRREELIGLSLLEHCPLHRQGDMFERYREVFESRRPYEAEFEVAGRRGERRWMRQQVVPIERGVAIWARDVTERRAADEERRRMELEFHRSQRLESLGLLAGGVAHDFNNLLTVILGNADIASRRLPPGSPAEAPLAELMRAAQRAADLTQKMLAFAGGGPIDIAWVSLNEVVQEMVELCRPALPPGREIRLALARPSPGLEADGTQMRQVVLNLLLNASEAIEGAMGAIELATGEVSCDSERLAAATHGAELPEGRYAFVRVSDDGVGMSAEVRARLFEPFFSTKFTGRGLGLAAVLGVVRAHRGAIEIESAPRQGTSVTVLLPIAQPAAA